MGQIAYSPRSVVGEDRETDTIDDSSKSNPCKRCNLRDEHCSLEIGCNQEYFLQEAEGSRRVAD